MVKRAPRKLLERFAHEHAEKTAYPRRWSIDAGAKGRFYQAQNLLFYVYGYRTEAQILEDATNTTRMDEHGLAFNWRDVPEIKSLAEAAAYLLEVAESYKFPFSYPDVEDAAEDIRIALAVLEAT